MSAKNNAMPMTEALAEAERKTLTEQEKEQLYEKLLSPELAETDPQMLLNMFFRIRVDDYIDYLYSTGRIDKRYKYSRYLELMKKLAKQEKCFDPDNLTIGMLFSMTRCMFTNCVEYKMPIENGRPLNIISLLLLYPIEILSSETRKDEKSC
ncbi:MAG: hypothetical protein J1F11_04500 [Oscillospiraceae bacterium]|nr:hypothetical protein [Oscillospiraceae bacterium]